MKRVGITQRVEVVERYNERRDCLDQRWSVLLGQCGILPVPLPNSYEYTENNLDCYQLDGLILSGGNDIGGIDGAINAAPERDHAENLLIEYCLVNNLPILGICRGMQMLAVKHGLKLCRVDGHAGCRHSINTSKEFSWYQHNGTVNSFHNYGIKMPDRESEIIPLAWSDDGYMEALRHVRYMHYGIMWHPERERTYSKGDLSVIRHLFL